MANIEISLEFDEKGYFYRDFSNEERLYKFKILRDDYNNKLREPSILLATM